MKQQPKPQLFGEKWDPLKRAKEYLIIKSKNVYNSLKPFICLYNSLMAKRVTIVIEYYPVSGYVVLYLSYMSFGRFR